jgi:hypothetical protein
MVTMAQEPLAIPGSMTEADKEMATYAISRVPVDYFYNGQFRYTNLTDAIAQAKRDQQRSVQPRLSKERRTVCEL